MSDKELPGYVLITSEARDTIEALAPHEKGELLSTLEWLRDHPTHPLETNLEVAGKTYQAIPLANAYTLIFRPLTVDELIRQGREPHSRGVAILDILPS